jgi:hypothetical protein
MLPFREKRGRGSALFRKGKGARMVALGSRVERRPKDAAVRRWPAFGLTRGERQPIELIGVKGYLGRILL